MQAFVCKNKDHDRGPAPRVKNSPNLVTNHAQPGASVYWDAPVVAPRRGGCGEHMERNKSKNRLVMSTIMASSTSDEDILDRLKEVLCNTFEIDPSRVTPSAHLFTDLELDSIDAVDLAIQVQEMTGMRIKPEDFKNVRTVGDVIATVHALLDR
jgi:acyl carrier protein